MSRDRETAGSPPVGSVDELVDFLREGEKPREAWRVGTEHEKIGLHADDLRRVPFDGPRGIEALLVRVAAEDGWDVVREGGRAVALEKTGASITLEPGGQLELSGAPLRTIFETCAEFHRHLEVIRGASEAFGIVWLSLGYDPLHDVEEVPRVPKDRYRIMREFLPPRGELAMHMMHMTATVQANVDYADEADMVRKMRTAQAISPVVSALFANSSLERGKPSGFVSKRLHIWRHTDPERCGLLPFVFDADFGYRRYAEWALDVPMFFVLRGGRYLPARGATFRAFLEGGLDGERATREDWDRHLTTLFPEVRLKRVLELRGADAVPPALTCALPALWKGILYDDAACEAAFALAAEPEFGERVAALEDVARRGLQARLGAHPVLDLAREVVALAAEGLRRIGHVGGDEPDERRFLEPLREVAEAGRSPGRDILERWEGEWGRSVGRLIDYARY